MPEFIADKRIFSLAEVSRSIQKTIAERYQSLYWIKAELNKLNYYAHSGHCYPDLLEKKEGKVIAEMRAILWKSDYQRINRRFLDTLQEPLKDGIHVLLQASIQYDPVYGLSLHIADIDPAYSLGELEREKQASIATLKAQGLFDTNKKLAFPLLPKRIALISVETSKGLADFLKIVDGNPYGYRFEHELFPALLQGDKAVASIIMQLHRIRQQWSQFDVVAIVRGGGGDVGLSAYNHLDLASAIAQFPLPVITGIGHSTNETVSEMVAYKNAITPSELADFLIQHFHNFARPVDRAKQILQEKGRQLLANQKAALEANVRYFRLGSRGLLSSHIHQVHRLSTQLIQQGKHLIAQQSSNLKRKEQDVLLEARRGLFQAKDQVNYCIQQLFRENRHFNRFFKQNLVQLQQQLHQGIKVQKAKQENQLEQHQQKLTITCTQYVVQHQQKLHIQERQLILLDPKQILKRGYSITLLNGKAITNAGILKTGEKLKTILAFGEVESAITFVKPEDEKE